MDTISDMLTRIRNAQAVSQETVDIPFSGLKIKIADILEKENFIGEIKKIKRDEKRFLRIFLKYGLDKKPLINGLKKISKPGQKIYRKANEIGMKKGVRGIIVVSTSKGIMTAREAAKQKIGGEIICQVW